MSAMTLVQLEELKKYGVPGASKALDKLQKKNKKADAKHHTNVK